MDKSPTLEANMRLVIQKIYGSRPSHKNPIYNIIYSFFRVTVMLHSKASLISGHLLPVTFPMHIYNPPMPAKYELPIVNYSVCWFRVAFVSTVPPPFH